MLAAPRETEVLVLEMAMRGVGQIAELCEIAEPDVAAITNVGPVHLELLGTLEAIAEAKAEIFAGLRDDGIAVVPADAEALEPHVHDGAADDRFGARRRRVRARAPSVADGSTEASIATPARRASEFRFPFTEAHNLANALAAIAIGVALDAPLAEMAERAPGIVFSRLRGELLELGDGVVIVNDCYNANPISMRAALDHLAVARRAGPADRRARRDGASWGRRRRALPPRGRRPRPRARDRPAGRGRRAARDYEPDELVADAASAAPSCSRAAARARRRGAGQGLALGRARAVAESSSRGSALRRGACRAARRHGRVDAIDRARS